MKDIISEEDGDNPEIDYEKNCSETECSELVETVIIESEEV